MIGTRQLCLPARAMLRNRWAATRFQVFREFLYETAYSHVIVRKRQFLPFIIDSLSNKCIVLFSYACIVTGEVFICRYIFMAMYSFVPPFSWGDILWCAVTCLWQIGVCRGWKEVAEHWSREHFLAVTRSAVYQLSLRYRTVSPRSCVIQSHTHKLYISISSLLFIPGD
jgi:hypothetical protein